MNLKFTSINYCKFRKIFQNCAIIYLLLTVNNTCYKLINVTTTLVKLTTFLGGIYLSLLRNIYQNFTCIVRRTCLQVKST